MVSLNNEELVNEFKYKMWYQIQNSQEKEAINTLDKFIKDLSADKNFSGFIEKNFKELLILAAEKKQVSIIYALLFTLEFLKIDIHNKTFPLGPILYEILETLMSSESKELKNDTQECLKLLFDPEFDTSKLNANMLSLLTDVGGKDSVNDFSKELSDSSYKMNMSILFKDEKKNAKSKSLVIKLISKGFVLKSVELYKLKTKEKGINSLQEKVKLLHQCDKTPEIDKLKEIQKNLLKLIFFNDQSSPVSEVRNRTLEDLYDGLFPTGQGGGKSKKKKSKRKKKSNRKKKISKRKVRRS